MSNELFFLIQNILKYVPFKICIKLRSCLYKFFFKSFGNNIVIHDNVLIKYPSDIIIGDGVQIASGCVIVGMGGLEIGANTIIGAGSKIVTSSDNYNRIDVPISEQGISSSPIIIGEDVWFGFNVIVLRVSIIGKGSILAAGAVVNSVHQEYSIVAGVPDKTIRSRLTII